MTKARGIFRLQLVVGLAGAAVTALALYVALGSVTTAAPSSQALFAACRSFVLPQLTPGSVVALALGSVAFAVLALAVRSALRQVRARRRFFAELRLLGDAGVGGAILFDAARPQAFCAGLLSARIYVSTGALAALASEELDAVLAHEAHHARFRDPLRIFFARILSDSLFFLPVLRRLCDRYAALAELAADSAAVDAHRGDSRPLAAALLVLGERADAAVVGIAPERVDYLLGQRPRWELPLALLAWATVVVGALLVVALRTEQATAHSEVSLPLVAAQLCMLAMAIVPLLLGAAGLLGSRRAVRALRQKPTS